MPERTVEDIKRDFEKKTGKKILPFDVEVMGGSDEDKAFETFFEYHEHLELDNLAKDKRILELEGERDKLINFVKAHARMGHYYCEDSWYSCPLVDGGSADSRKPKDKCDCGADEHNKMVNTFLDQFKPKES